MTQHIILHCIRFSSPAELSPWTNLRLQHDFGQMPPLLRGKTGDLELLEAVSKPLSLLQAAQLAGLH